MSFWKHTIKLNCLAWLVGWNLIKLAYEVFVQNYGLLCLENFDCPTGVSPLLFSQLGVAHHYKAGGLQSDSITLNTNGQQQLSNKKPKILPSMKMGC